MGILDDAAKAADEELARMKAEEAAREKAAKEAEQKVQAGIMPDESS